MSAVKINALLAEALEAHGGRKRWLRFKGASATLLDGGKLLGLKGLEIDSAQRRRVVSTDFHRQWTQVAPFGDPDYTMTWVPEHVEIRASAGKVVAERDNPRGSFAGHAFDTPWDMAHFAYFHGYAMWTYFAAPFVFAEPGYQVTDIAPIAQNGTTLRGISVRFPDSVHTHTREQRFYFGPDGLLARHDYEVDVWARFPAAHFLSDYVDVDGLKFPAQRKTYLRYPDGSADSYFNAVWIVLSDYKLRR